MPCIVSKDLDDQEAAALAAALRAAGQLKKAKARGGEKPDFTPVNEDFSPTSAAGIFNLDCCS
jgi:hypothetical protein